MQGTYYPIDSSVVPELPDAPATPDSELSLSVPDLIKACKLTRPDRRAELDGLLTRYMRKQINKQQLQVQLRLVVGRPPLRAALLSLVPTVDAMSQRRELTKRVEALAELGADGVALLRTDRYQGLLLPSACSKCGASTTLLRALGLGADPNLECPLALTLDVGKPEAMQRQLACARALLTAGASVLQAAPQGGSPLEVAQAQRAGSTLVAGSAAALVLATHDGWSRATHRYFPVAERARAVELLRLGQLLSRQPRWVGAAQAVVDVWQAEIMPQIVSWS